MVVCLLALGSCSSREDQTIDVTGLDNPTSDLEMAHALVVFGAPQSDLVPFPDEILLSFLECVRDGVDGELIFDAAAGGREVPAPVEGLYEQQVISSDCALSNGLDEFAPIWTPITQSEIDSVIAGWWAAWDLCTAEAGIEEYPTIELSPGFVEPDFVAMFAQDLSIEAPLNECMLREGQELPGNETPPVGS